MRNFVLYYEGDELRNSKHSNDTAVTLEQAMILLGQANDRYSYRGAPVCARALAFVAWLEKQEAEDAAYWLTRPINSAFYAFELSDVYSEEFATY